MLVKLRPHAQRQQGVAIVTALFYMALAATLAVGMAFSQRLNIKRLEHVLDSDREVQSAELVVAWAQQILQQKVKNQTEDYDGLDQDWAQAMEEQKVGDLSISGRIIDGERFFNLNNLIKLNPVGKGSKGTKSFLREF